MQTACRYDESPRLRYKFTGKERDVESGLDMFGARYYGSSLGRSATGTLYWMGWGSDANAETDLSGNVLENYVFFNGQRVAREDASSGAVHYYFSDHLGTHSLITDASGDMPPQEESDYYPYGGEIPVSGSDPNHYKFTGKERDSESGLDMFGARYYGSSLGRFMTPDSITYSGLDDPQSLNLYSYAGNHSTFMVDPDGRCWKGFSLLCDVYQRFANAASGDAFRTDKQLDNTVPANDRRTQRKRQQETKGQKPLEPLVGSSGWWT